MFPEMLGYESNINNAQKQGLLGGAAALFGPRKNRGQAVIENMLAGQNSGARLDADEAERARKALELQKKRQAAQFFYPTVDAEQLSRMPETALDDMLSTGVNNQFEMTPQVKHFNLGQENQEFMDFVNPPPPGFVYGEPDPETGIRPQIARPGSKQELDRRKAESAAAAKQEGETNTSTVMVREASKAIELINTYGQGVAGWGALLANMPATNARTLRQAITTLEANIGFDGLNDLRAQSESGAALGAVQVKELEFLQKAQGSLDQFQDPAILIENIKAITASHAMFLAATTGDTSGLTPEQRLELARAWEADFGGGAQ